MFARLGHSRFRYQFIGGEYDPARRSEPRTALQQHVDFFDRNRDGILTAREISRGLGDLGIAPPVARPILALAVSLFLGRRTWAVLHPTLTINVDAIHRGRHGSSTGIFRADGTLDEARFDVLFATYDKDGDGAIEEAELQEWMTRKAAPGLAQALDRFFASRELPTLFREFAERNAHGVRTLPRAKLLDFYQGALFPELARARSKQH